MLVVHANWTDGALRLWAESLELCLANDRSPAPVAAEASEAVAKRHTFVLPTSELRQVLASACPEGWSAGPIDESCELHLQLPHSDAGPRPSDRLAGVVGAPARNREIRLERCIVRCLTIRNEDAIAMLLGLESNGDGEGIEFGHSLRYWMTVARFVLELLEDQRFIPTLLQSRASHLEAAWRPWLRDDAVTARAGALIVGMPPIVRAAVDAHAHRPWSILEEALKTLTDATIRRALIEEGFAEALEGRADDEDQQAAWLGGLLGERSSVRIPGDSGTEMLHEAGNWITGLEAAGRDPALHLGFTLHEPPAAALPDDLKPCGPEVVWRLSLHLVCAGERSAVVDAEQVWRDPSAAQPAAGGLVRDPEELLLAELGRAARLYAKLQATLCQAQPTGIDLTTDEAYEFLSEYKDLLEESGFPVFVPQWWGSPRSRLTARMKIKAPDLDERLAGGGGSSAAGRSLLGLRSLVKFRWHVAVGEEPLEMRQFQALLRWGARGSLVRLQDRWVEVRPEQLKEAASFLDAGAEGEMTLLEAVRLAYGGDGARFGLPVFGMDATGWVADLLGASSGEARLPNLAQPRGFVGKLRPYQLVGLNWLSFLDRFGLGACLADDMGLGKTIQLIALLLSEREQAGNGEAMGPTLLIVPTSVASNWQRELARFAPSLTQHLQHGADRPVGDDFVKTAQDRDVVITTYALVSRDRETIARVSWHRVVLDEAQFIKNPPTKQTVTIRSLETTRRVALTGTPVENRLSELWSIMEFCNPGYLGQPGEFRRRFSVPIERHRDHRRAEQLRTLVRPFVLRRLKTDPTVIDDLPPCVVTKEYATLTGEQAALYQQAVNEMLGRVGRAEGIQRRGLVLAALVKLKQICNHPGQVAAGRAAGATPVGRGADAHRLGPQSVALLSSRSGKARRLMEMLEEVLAVGDKALVFTQFRQMGHLLAAMMQHDLDTDMLFLHGGTPPRKRQQMIDRFQDPRGGVPVFILSLKAGGLGLNLTAANHVFHFDRWWNPAVENQATDRAFRIGQQRTVHVHKFVCQGTLEERIDQMIEEKTVLAQNIIGAGEEWLTELSTGQLRELLALQQSAMETDV